MAPGALRWLPEAERLREVHPAEQYLESGIQSNRVEDRMRADRHAPGVAHLHGAIQPLEGAIDITQAEQDPRER